MSAFLDSTFNKLASLVTEGEPLSLHDPLCIFYLLASLPVQKERQDIRVETAGQWTLGQTVVDGRRRQRAATPPAGSEIAAEDLEGTKTGDEGGWLGAYGNRVCVAEGETGWKDTVGEEMVRRILL